VESECLKSRRPFPITDTFACVVFFFIIGVLFGHCVTKMYIKTQRKTQQNKDKQALKEKQQPAAK
jgi:Na+/glutamate symporter